MTYCGLQFLLKTFGIIHFGVIYMSFFSEEIMYPVIDNLEYVVKKAITKPTTTDSKKQKLVLKVSVLKKYFILFILFNQYPDFHLKVSKILKTMLNIFV